jgi:hypothetical protein
MGRLHRQTTRYDQGLYYPTFPHARNDSRNLEGCEFHISRTTPAIAKPRRRV